jgi:hypothetical protein
VGSANNGDTYSCTVSNNTGSPNVLTSAAATLTVVPNVALPPAVLYETKSANPTAALASQRDEYDGVVGGTFTVGSAGAVVTHLGFYDVYGDGLNHDHTVSIWNSGGSVQVATVDVPIGTAGYLTNFYRYAALTTPVVLTPNTSYILQADTYPSPTFSSGRVATRKVL